MADADWTEVHDKGKIRSWQATINSTDVDTAVLEDSQGLNLNAKEIKITINIGATESAIAILGSVKPGAVEADGQPLVGATAIATDFDYRIEGGMASLQITGAASANDTVITVTQVG